MAAKDEHASYLASSQVKLFKYGFGVRNTGYLFAVVYLTMALGLSVYGFVRPHDQTLVGLIGVWSILIPLILLAIWKQRTDSVELREVEVSEKGILAQLRKNQVEYLPKTNVQFIPWTSIDSYEEFSRPDTDDFNMFGIDGVRLQIKKFDRKISIYTKINGYE